MPKKVKSTPAPVDHKQKENLKQVREVKAATKIQRAFRRMQKLRLMRMAVEAIEDSERIMIGRQRHENIANIDIDGMHDRHDRNPLKESLDDQHKHIWSAAREDFSVFAPNLKEQKSDANRPRDSNSKPTRSNELDDKDSPSEDGEEENKLAALNEMLKGKKFAIQREDEEDFEMFLQKLNEKRQKDLGSMIEEKKVSPTKPTTIDRYPADNHTEDD